MSDELRTGSGGEVLRTGSGGAGLCQLRGKGAGKRETSKRFRKRYSQRLAELESQLAELQGSCKEALASLQAAGAHIADLEQTNRRLEQDVSALQQDAAESGIVIRQDQQTGRLVAQRALQEDHTLSQLPPQAPAQPLALQPKQQDSGAASTAPVLHGLPGASRASGSAQGQDSLAGRCRFASREGPRGEGEGVSGEGEGLGCPGHKAPSPAPVPPSLGLERCEDLVPDMNLQSLLCSFQEDGEAFLAGL